MVALLLDNETLMLDRGVVTVGPYSKEHAAKAYQTIANGQKGTAGRNKINVAHELESLVMSVGEVGWMDFQQVLVGVRQTGRREARSFHGNP